MSTDWINADLASLTCAGLWLIIIRLCGSFEGISGGKILRLNGSSIFLCRLLSDLRQLLCALQSKCLV